MSKQGDTGVKRHDRNVPSPPHNVARAPECLWCHRAGTAVNPLVRMPNVGPNGLIHEACKPAYVQFRDREIGALEDGG